VTPKEAVAARVPGAVVEAVETGPHPFVRVKPEHVVEAARALRDALGAQMLHLVSGVDHADRMEVVYHFARVDPPAAMHCLKVTLPREAPELPTLAGDWESANWLERETWDLLGIRFAGHPHPYRILLPEDWEGHPLRKDYVFPTEYHGIDCTK